MPRKSKLKLFEGFSLDMASDFSGLTPGKIEYARKQGLVTPVKKSGYYQYSFSDILVLRVIFNMNKLGIPVRNIKKAKEYLSRVGPDQNLQGLTLYAHTGTGTILYFDDPQVDSKFAVNISRFGQLMQKNVLTIVKIGRDLDLVKEDVRDLDSTLSERIAKPKLIPMDKFFANYGVG